MLGDIQQPDIFGTIVSSDTSFPTSSDYGFSSNLASDIANVFAGYPSTSASIPCIPQGAFGPLQPGQSYCAGGASGAGPSASGINWWLLGGVLVAMVLISHHR